MIRELKNRRWKRIKERDRVKVEKYWNNRTNQKI